MVKKHFEHVSQQPPRKLESCWHCWGGGPPELQEQEQDPAIAGWRGASRTKDRHGHGEH